MSALQGQTRRLLLGSLISLGARTPSFATSSLSLLDLINHPVLHTLYSRGLSETFNGLAGLNIPKFNTIEEQRYGAEWILRAKVARRPEWALLGWEILDRGLEFQAEDGGFGRWGYLHANSLFIEALARACIIDPGGATSPRRIALHKGAKWLCNPSRNDLAISKPYTHRRYVLAAALGQAGYVLRDKSMMLTAEAWAVEGLLLQKGNGVNPEAGGWDVSYQMVGPLYALRYIPVCGNESLVSRLCLMIQKALEWEVMRMLPNGEIDVSGSTRIGREKFGKDVKTMNYYEAFQTFAYAGQIVSPAWLVYADRIARLKNW